MTGVQTCALPIFGSSWIFWNLIKATIGLRVPPEEELEGLDVGEHGIMAYPEFQLPGDSMPLEERNERPVLLPAGQLVAEREKL